MAHPSEPRLLVLHGLRLKGFAEAEVVAGVVALEQADVEQHLDELQAEALVVHREGRMSGWSLTPTGRKEGERLLAEELDAAGAGDVVGGAYRRFSALNHDLLALCTDWQLRTVDGQQAINDHSDAAYDAQVIER